MSEKCEYWALGEPKIWRSGGWAAGVDGGWLPLLGEEMYGAFLPK